MPSKVERDSVQYQMNLVMRKAAFCLCENKDAARFSHNEAQILSGFQLSCSVEINLTRNNKNKI